MFVGLAFMTASGWRGYDRGSWEPWGIGLLFVSLAVVSLHHLGYTAPPEKYQDTMGPDAYARPGPIAAETVFALSILAKGLGLFLLFFLAVRDTAIPQLSEIFAATAFAAMVLTVSAERMRMNRSLLPRKPIALSLFWLAAGVALHMSMIALLSRLWVGALVPWGLHLAVGAVLAAYLAIRFAASRNLVTGIALALVLAGLTVFIFARGSLMDAGNVIAFRWLQPAYQRVIDTAAMKMDARAALISSGPDDQVQFAYFSDETDLIVFPWLNGVPDGGLALVYDRSGEIPAAGSVRSARLHELVYSGSSRCRPFGAASFFLCEFD